MAEVPTRCQSHDVEQTGARRDRRCSGSGRRALSSHTSWAVVAAPTLARAFARLCFTVECDGPGGTSLHSSVDIEGLWEQLVSSFICRMRSKGYQREATLPRNVERVWEGDPGATRRPGGRAPGRVARSCRSAEVGICREQAHRPVARHACALGADGTGGDRGQPAADVGGSEVTGRGRGPAPAQRGNARPATCVDRVVRPARSVRSAGRWARAERRAVPIGQAGGRTRPHCGRLRRRTSGRGARC